MYALPFERLHERMVAIDFLLLSSVGTILAFENNLLDRHKFYNNYSLSL